MSPDAAALKAAADRAAASGDVRGARANLRQAAALEREDVGLWLALAGRERALGAPAAAMEALDQALRIEPRLFVALLMKASLLEQAGLARAAATAYATALTQAPAPERLDPATRKALERGQALHAKYLDELHAALEDDARDALALCAPPQARRLGRFIDQITGRRKVFQQAPVNFHYPGLPAIEFYEREEFGWLEDVEAETGAIRDEYLAAMAEDQPGLTPYVEYPPGLPVDQWAELNHSSRWSALHLHRDGELIEANARRCPRTLAVLAKTPQPVVAGRSPASMFSVLAPHTRIPPHTGVANTRLVVHLPLIVPEGCGFRVGNETRPWREGEAWVFDDTIEHEAWNDSDRPRAVLIFDIWSPRIDPAERAAIAGLMAAIDRFNGEPSARVVL